MTESKGSEEQLADRNPFQNCAETPLSVGGASLAAFGIGLAASLVPTLVSSDLSAKPGSPVWWSVMFGFIVSRALIASQESRVRQWDSDLLFLRRLRDLDAGYLLFIFGVLLGLPQTLARQVGRNFSVGHLGFFGFLNENSDVLVLFLLVFSIAFIALFVYITATTALGRWKRVGYLYRTIQVGSVLTLMYLVVAGEVWYSNVSSYLSRSTLDEFRAFVFFGFVLSVSVCVTCFMFARAGFLANSLPLKDRSEWAHDAAFWLALNRTALFVCNVLFLVWVVRLGGDVFGVFPVLVVLLFFMAVDAWRVKYGIMYAAWNLNQAEKWHQVGCPVCRHNTDHYSWCSAEADNHRS